MEEIYKMAGRVAAHAVLSVSGGELLIPIYGYLDEDGKTRMTRIAAESGDEAMQVGQQLYSDNPSNAAGAAWVVDGFITLKEVGKVDALLFKICSYANPQREMQLAVPYRHANSNDGFAVFKPKVIGLSHLAPDELQPLIKAFFEGRDEHTEAAALWREKQQDEVTSTTGYAGFSGDEWEHLRDAPLAIFCIVAGADGKIDKKEADSFGKLFKDSGKFTSLLMQRVMAELSPHTPQGQGILLNFLQRYTSDQFNRLHFFAQLNSLLTTKSEEPVSNAFKSDLLAFGKTVAESSGGFFGFGSKVSKEEKTALAMIETLIMSPPELSQLLAEMAGGN